MSQFIQLHLLTSYPPANLNRDDLGRPKTAVMGGATRLRVSSQSLKRAWRDSDHFQEALAGHLGTRTKVLGLKLLEVLRESGLDEKEAKEIARTIAGHFGKVQSETLATEQLVFYSPEEWEAAMDLARRLGEETRQPSEEEIQLLRHRHSAADVALFGRMVAATPAFNVEAAAQVAHAITVHEVQVEDDFFSAVDDLNVGRGDSGAAHLGEIEFGAGLFYLYICVDRDLLVDNLSGDEELAGRALRALVEAAATQSPRGKQATFGSRAHASYVLAEKGRQQPRSLAVSFLKPVANVRKGYLEEAIERLNQTRENIDSVYGADSTEPYVMDATQPAGRLAELLDYVAEPLPKEG